MNTPDQTAVKLVDLAIHQASFEYHNPTLGGTYALQAWANSPEDHYLLGEALIRFLSSRYEPGEWHVTVGEGARLDAVWHHRTSNGHTYRCDLTIEAPE